MKRIFAIITTMFLVAGCVDSLDDYNQDRKRASEAPARTFFTGAVKNLTDLLTTPNVNTNNFRLYSQQWATTTYLNEPRYNMVSRTYSQNFWQAAYRDVLSDLKEARRLIDNDIVILPETKANQLALIGVIEVYTWMVLVNTFGDIPYSEALNPDNSLPKYDDDAAIYADLVTRLDAAIASMISGKPSFGAADVIYAGNVDQWIKFANSLKLKIALILADVDPAKAKTMAEQTAGKVLTANSDNARFPYAASPNNNPVSQNLNPLFTSREDFVVASTIVDPMNALNDPRRPFYFTTVGGAYIGGRYGFENSYDEVSHPSDKVTATTFEGLLMDHAEVEFMLAEAVERGFNVGGTAAEHYENAIRSSILYWGGTAAEATVYINQPGVAYATAPGTFKQKIGFQKWLALYNRGWEAWNEWKRLDAPALLPPAGEGITTDLSIPVRMIYPVSEQTQNGTQRNLAANAIGGDLPSVKIFWDKN